MLSMNKFSKQDPNNPFRTIWPADCDMVLVPVCMSTLGTRPKMILARVYRADVVDPDTIVEFDAKLHEAHPLAFCDGAFIGNIRWDIASIANRQANILIDTGIVHPTIIRAFQEIERRTMPRAIELELSE